MSLSHEDTNPLTETIIGAAIEVHRNLGPGLLESIYEDCLCWELRQCGIAFLRQPFLPVIYKGSRLAAWYRPDLVIDSKVIVEVKAVEKVIEVHSAQLLTYMKLTEIRVGLLFNFNAPNLVGGMKRLSL